MVESTDKAQYLAELEWKTEEELETIISSEPANADDARYVLGRLHIEGTFPENVEQNEGKGINWLKTASKNGHLLALEFKTYHDIRFDSSPNIDKITGNLEKVCEEGKSTRAANTLAEFAHSQIKKDKKNEEVAAKYYALSAE
jgi:TPR repeat protein